MSLRSIVIFGGTGARAGPMVHSLSATNKFKITVPTRNTSSEDAIRLSKLPHVSLIEATYDTEKGLRDAFADQESCYFIINSFAIREPDE
ncbi:Putative NmrA-like domain, NAD(P)-binding domain superfamily [Septoria linicola]|uniref:NmrA-like domain, NAD(P)-binding domain superfamily n=1 Tax=Septoria linicola TaxID=215465 RepID=A0A9Q9EQH2_9PEZI|nr:putative NmrA-like domain, NAD(P)-binding domain superfamily [Septoria linicola]USW58787.1 Putative NmrA-like domain, NAD(P)-binding domain superfamily [Septoria linicola]